MLERLADDLVEQGWAIVDDFLPPVLTRALAGECRQRHAQGLLTEAGTGRGNAQRIRSTLRGDSIQWLEPGQSRATDDYLRAMDALRQTLNASLYLGLEDFESHFALYPSGAFYLRHLDRFRDDDRRELSAILYLNEDWSADAGGELRLFFDVQGDAPCKGVIRVGRGHDGIAPGAACRGPAAFPATRGGRHPGQRPPAHQPARHPG